MNLAQLDKKAWQQIAVLFAIIGGFSAGWVSWSLSGGGWGEVFPAGLLGVIIVGALIVLVGSVNLKLNHLNQELNGLKGDMQQGHLSLREMTNIRPLLEGPPLDFSNWAVDPHFGKILAQLINRYQPGHIVECGSGTSTVLAAQLQRRETPRGKVTALEHLSKYAEKSRQLLEDHGLTEQAEVVLAPLRDWDIGEHELPWYDVDLDRFSGETIDMMIVDGPPGSTGPLARYPAVFVLKPYLSENCVIVMDDGNRPDEERAAQRWAELLEADLEYVDGPKGTFILRR